MQLHQPEFPAQKWMSLLYVSLAEARVAILSHLSRITRVPQVVLYFEYEPAMSKSAASPVFKTRSCHDTIPPLLIDDLHRSQYSIRCQVPSTFLLTLSKLRDKSDQTSTSRTGMEASWTRRLIHNIFVRSSIISKALQISGISH